MATLTELLAPHGIVAVDDLLAEIEVPVLTGVQRQGDVLIVPRGPLSAAERSQTVEVPAEGIPVVVGEATGNTHILSADGRVLFGRRDAGLLLGVVEVPAGSTGHLIHTDEHGANSIGVGCFELRGKQEQADIVRRVAD